MTPYYDRDGITIYHGDCREILPSLPPVDVAFADPPYGVGLTYDVHVDEGGPAYEEWMSDMRRMLTEKARIVFVTPGIRNLHLWLDGASWLLSWHKPGSTRRSDLGGFNVWEPVVMYGKRRIYNDAVVLPDVVNHAKDTAEHPCPKPLRLLTWLLSVSVEDDSIVLDPFMGSGTTLVAASQFGVRAIGVEISERYCEIAAKRLAQGVLDFGGAA